MANAPQAADAKKRLEKEFSPKDKQSRSLYCIYKKMRAFNN
jgi:hypothetical protein